MTEIDLLRRAFLGAGLSLGSFLTTRVLFGDEPASREDLKEPLLRVSRKNDPPIDKNSQPHPLDEAIAIANEALVRIRTDIKDYKCLLVKRERVAGKLGDHEYMFAKIRNRKEEDGKLITPFAIYLYFVKPESVKGRECLYVEGENSGKMIAHEGGAAARLLPSVWLAPDGPIAMRGNLYPITEAGIENLIVKLIERGDRDRKRDECKLEFRENAKINGRACRIMEVVHPTRRAYFDFNLAQIYIDKEYQLPVRYAAYSWPQGQDHNPEPKPSDNELIEEYTYMKLELNPGFEAVDFESKNPNYNFGK